MIRRQSGHRFWIFACITLAGVIAAATPSFGQDNPGAGPPGEGPQHPPQEETLDSIARRRVGYTCS